MVCHRTDIGTEPNCLHRAALIFAAISFLGLLPSTLLGQVPSPKSEPTVRPVANLVPADQNDSHPLDPALKIARQSLRDFLEAFSGIDKTHSETHPTQCHASGLGPCYIGFRTCRC